MLGHVLAAPVDPTVAPRTSLERVFTTAMIMSSLLVIASVISKVSNTIAELNRMNLGAMVTKVQLQRYLNVSGVGPQLSSRVLRFALHAHQRKYELSLDESVSGLLSHGLQAQVLVADVDGVKRHAGAIFRHVGPRRAHRGRRHVGLEHGERADSVGQRVDEAEEREVVVVERADIVSVDEQRV